MISFYTTITAITLSAVSFGQNVPIDFETGGNGSNWTWTVFENNTNPVLEIVPNPNPSGINTSSTVAKFTALQTGNPWAGCESMHGSDIGTFDITANNYVISIMVYKTKISDVGIKLVTATNGSLGEIKVPNTKVNQWEELTFDFSAHIGGMTYDQIVIFPDFIARPADDIIYFDNIWGGTSCAPTSSSFSATSCGTYTSPSGAIWSTTGLYVDTIPNMNGCDSIMDINLTINSVNNSTVTTDGTIMANALVSAYQWLDCDNSFTAIPGEVNQSYTPTANGNYAVMINTDGCIDTSECVAISNLGLNLADFDANTYIYPNPSNGEFTIDSDLTLESVKIYSLSGKLVYASSATQNTLHINLSALESGVYLVELQSTGVSLNKRIIKQ